MARKRTLQKKNGVGASEASLVRQGWALSCK
jgi:hypothetical protein